VFLAASFYYIPPKADKYFYFNFKGISGEWISFVLLPFYFQINSRALELHVIGN